MTRLTDYGIVLLTYIARDPQKPMHNARDLAASASLPLPTANKVLKALTRKGLLVSHRGVKGGYGLARRPEEISVADIITATEGPMAMSRRPGARPTTRALDSACSVHSNWQTINRAIRQALESITLSEMACPIPAPPSPGRNERAGEGARVTP